MIRFVIFKYFFQIGDLFPVCIECFVVDFLLLALLCCKEILL